MDNPVSHSALAVFLMLMLRSASGRATAFMYKPGRILKQLGTPVIADAKHRADRTTTESREAALVVTRAAADRRAVPSSDAEIANSATRSDHGRIPLRKCRSGIFRRADRTRVVAMLIVCIIAGAAASPTTRCCKIVLHGLGLHGRLDSAALLSGEEGKKRQETCAFAARRAGHAGGLGRSRAWVSIRRCSTWPRDCRSAIRN